jgi:hypothetical protein
MVVSHGLNTSCGSPAWYSTQVIITRVFFPSTMVKLPTELWLLIYKFQRFFFQYRVKELEQKLKFPIPTLIHNRVDGQPQLGHSLALPEGFFFTWYRYEEEFGVDYYDSDSDEEGCRWMMDIRKTGREQLGHARIPCIHTKTITIEFPYTHHEDMMIHEYSFPGSL